MLNRIRPVLSTRVVTPLRAPVFTPKYICARSLPLDDIAVGIDFNTVSYFTGKSIILFTLFYCSLNWKYYRDMMNGMDGDDENDDKYKGKNKNKNKNKNKK